MQFELFIPQYKDRMINDLKKLHTYSEKRKFVLVEMFQRKALKFVIVLEYENPLMLHKKLSKEHVFKTYC